MRARTNKGGIAAVAIVAAIALGIFGSSSVPAFREGPVGAARLVSIEQMPDVGEMCLWEPVSATTAIPPLFVRAINLLFTKGIATKRHRNHRRHFDFFVVFVTFCGHF